MKLFSVMAALSVTLPLTVAQQGAGHEGFWVAGDFHVHTTYSHDSWDPVDDDEESEPWTLGHSVSSQFAIAASRGLDFLTISDHNDIRAYTDPGFGSGGVSGVRAYENSLSGHAQMLGAPIIYDRGDRSADAINAMADALRADGGAFQVNHPAGDSVDFPHDADWDYAYDVVPDSVEVWNIQSVWQPPAFSSNSIDDALAYWEGWLDRGHKIAATGGSDNHWVSTTAVQGVGQPTTWVYVTELSEEAIIDAVLAGRTSISWQPPVFAGPRLYLEADTDDDGEADAMVGDTVDPAVAFSLRVENAPPGSWVQVHTDRGAELISPVAGATAVDLTVPEGASWVWADLVTLDHGDLPAAPYAPQPAEICDDQVGGDTTYCRNRLVRLAMTSAMFLAT